MKNTYGKVLESNDHFQGLLEFFFSGNLFEDYLSNGKISKPGFKGFSSNFKSIEYRKSK